ncbi:uncharacterized protein LOC134855339 [Symsagittifera roscoffensis]|uniref:uncharacterized protein LOC134855339 n=1 Tax=Symsagittifera roscoffensis TaxID=84072 RepID=UPI00307C355D
MEPTAPPMSFSENDQPPCQLPPPAYDYGANTAMTTPLVPQPGMSNVPFRPPSYRAYDPNTGGTNWANAGRPNELARPPSPQPVAAPRNVNIFLVNPGNENNARQRRESIVSENTVSAGDRTHEALQFDAWTKCSWGVLAKANRLSETFNQLRRVNKNIGSGCHRAFPVGGRGCCGGMVSVTFELATIVYAVLVPLYVVSLRRQSKQQNYVQMMPNLLMWILLLIYLILFTMYLIAFGVHRVNRYRFRNCPWIIKAATRNYLLMGKMAAFRETDPDEMQRNCRLRALSKVRAQFGRNNPAWGMYYSSSFYRKNIRSVTFYLLCYLTLIVTSTIFYMYLGLLWSQIKVP